MPQSRTQIQLPSDRDSTGRDLGDAELDLLTTAIRSGHLNSTGGTLTPRFEAAFAARHGVGHAIACASGSAAVHAALGALQLAPGDEVVTTSITDMGALMPICYEGATPVFADVDPATANVTAATIAARLTERTRAVIVTHLFGQPCDMGPIVELVRGHGAVLIEDAAQAFLATDQGRLIGTHGDLACFSFQQGKHMTTGEGGIVITDSPEHADGVTRFVNKGWGYGDARPDHDRPGLNFRMTELQSAVGLAQLQKLDGVVERRRARAVELGAALRDLPGLGLPDPDPAPGRTHSFWRYVLRLDPAVFAGGPDAFGAHLTGGGVHNAPRYIQKPAFECAVFRDAKKFASIAPGCTAPAVDRADYPGTAEALDRMLVLPWNEHYTAAHVAGIAGEIRAAHAACSATD